MNKFMTLLKKEIKELLTLQLVIPLLIGMLFFVFIGNIIGNEGKKAQEQQTVLLIDNDRTSTSVSIKDILAQNGFKIETPESENTGIEAAINLAKSKSIPVILSIPSGFEAGIGEGIVQEIGIYSIVRNLSIFSSSGSSVGKMAISVLNEVISNELIASKTGLDEVSALKNPITPEDFVVVGETTANLDPDVLFNFIMSQTTFLPIVIFIVIIFASQMIVVAIASEKENKTLETLLSSPISRLSLVVSKMTAAGLVSLFMAAVYMGGFKNYMDGITGASSGGAAANPDMAEILSKLGLDIPAGGYVLLGVSLFLSILDALSLSLILGVFAEDVKKAQGLIAPLTFLIMIPYLITMFIDLRTTSPILRCLIYAIPFTHTFTATSNLFLHEYMPVVYGVVYQAVVLAVLVYICARIFSTDKVVTMKLKLRGNRKSTVPTSGSY